MYSISINGNNALVGNYSVFDNNGTSTSNRTAGAAYIYNRNNSGTWGVENNGVYEQNNIIIADDRSGADWFGISVSISETNIIVGAHKKTTGGSNTGVAYIFTPTITQEFDYSSPIGLETPTVVNYDIVSNSLPSVITTFILW